MLALTLRAYTPCTLRVQQEDAESQLPGMPTQQPPASATSRKGIHFADSVRRVEDEPCAARVSGLTSPVLVVMMASLAYLMETLQVRFRQGGAAGSWPRALVQSTGAVGYPFGELSEGCALPTAHTYGARLRLSSRVQPQCLVRCLGSKGLPFFRHIVRTCLWHKWPQGLACPHAHAWQAQVLLLVYNSYMQNMWIHMCMWNGRGREMGCMPDSHGASRAKTCDTEVSNIRSHHSDIHMHHVVFLQLHTCSCWPRQ